MAEYTRMAVVKLDPPESYSTGGIVVDIVQWWNKSEAIANGNQVPANYYDDAGPYKNPYEGKSGYKCVPSETAQVNWIYTDKTNELIAG